jgi:uncharacterized protein (DUF488 family)
VLYTIGYEGRTLDELIAALKSVRVERLIDVREMPLSRRRGFSKTPLAAALAAQDIEYVHLRQAGNPFRKDAGDVLAKYKAALGKRVVDDVVAAAHGRRVSLLCYERNPGECHRSILAKRIARRLGATPIDL